MYDWIIEADAYRLNKAASEADNPREQLALRLLAQEKLAKLKRRAVPVHEDAGGTDAL